ncbi:MAG: class I SAM-dependent methyltransferase [Planctomycetota bacterium]
MSDGPKQPRTETRSNVRATAKAYDDDDARRYVETRRRGPRRRFARSFEVRRLLGAAPDAGTVLDVPAGGGRFDGLRGLVTCDVSHGMATQCSERGFRALRGDAFALPFGDDAFELLLSLRFLHHFESTDRVRALAEFRRVATAAVVTYFGDTGFKAWRRARSTKERTRRGVSKQAFASDCVAAGWTVERDFAVLPGFSEQRIVVLLRA